MAYNNKEEQQVLEKFERLKFQDYSREGKDIEFKDENLRLKEIAEVLDEVKDFVQDELKGKSNIHTTIVNALKEFNEICSAINSFNASDKNSVQNSEQIRRRARQFHDQIFTGENVNNFSSLPTLAVDWRLRKNNPEEVGNIVDQIIKDRDKAAKLVKQIEDSSRTNFAQNYSKIFHNEALNHSRFKINKDESEEENSEKNRVGQSERFLILGIILITILFLLVLLNFFIPDGEDLQSELELVKNIGIESVSYTQILIPYYVKKIIVLGLILFGIKFSFKQYSIHKHLHTINKHRANTLDSFQFFYENLKDGEAESRDQYLIEVAKSIFSTTDTGFIKSDSKDTVSFIDNFKLFKDKI
ncbi:MAG: hypothetical protein GVY20_16880 [Bacteroidetes bacterium]|jgi:hypothetical protein|nr:hypothetical protein [Bacteroidota bacterium]